MYSDNPIIQELVALMKAHGITDCVLCPGSRNAGLVLSLSQDSDFNCRAITDERSAGFLAMGIALNTVQTVAVVCTSGSALLNIYPSVAEAYYQQIPLLIISADRPEQWIGQMDGQTIPQKNILAPLVKHSVHLNKAHDKQDLVYANRLINEAILSTQGLTRGPAHINIALDEPLFEMNTAELPKTRKIEKIYQFNAHNSEGQALIKEFERLPKRIVLVGQMNLIYLFNKRDEKKLYKQFVWLKEHSSNQTIPGFGIENFDLIIRSADPEVKEELRPDLLITYGGHIISKEMKQYLRAYPPKEHWHICPNGELIDLFSCLTKVIVIDPFVFLEAIASYLPSTNPQYPKRWDYLSKQIPQASFPYSEMSVVEELFKLLASNCSLHLANSSLVRYAQLFPLNKSVEVCSNRGVNGIEGSLSTAIGYASSSKKMNVILIGDLSFFYDSNALWNAYVGTNVRILVLNNQGGEIFYNLKGLKHSPEMDQFLVAEHQSSVKAWAIDQGLDYQSAHNEEDLAQALDFLLAQEDVQRARIVEVFTDKKEDIKLLQEYYHSLKQYKL